MTPPTGPRISSARPSPLAPAKALADIVVNHRNGYHTDKADFEDPAFADNAAAVVSDDECKCGTGHGDTGEGEKSSRDLDHTNASVQAEIIKYLAMLQNDIGFAGWRYDKVKGYDGQFVAIYNDASQPYLSVGEFLDSNRQLVVNWIDATAGKSMAFDFPTRYLLKQAIRDQDFGQLETIDGKPTGLIGWWPAMSVTFVENHDTEKDRDHPDEFGNGDQVLQGYAYILTHPGIPCVFWVHFFDYGPTIRQKIADLIRIRKQAGVNSGCCVNIQFADHDKYAAYIQEIKPAGNAGQPPIVEDKLAVKIGPGPWNPPLDQWHVAADGPDYAVWARN